MTQQAPFFHLGLEGFRIGLYFVLGLFQGAVRVIQFRIQQEGSPEAGGLPGLFLLKSLLLLMPLLLLLQALAGAARNLMLLLAGDGEAEETPEPEL